MQRIVSAVLCLAVTAHPAAAQSSTRLRTSSSGGAPHLSVGLAVGLFGEVDETSANDSNPILSGTVEIPYARHQRIRIEAGRTRLPLLPPGTRDPAYRIDTAHISQFTVGVAGVREPGAPVSGYVGAGLGVYGATFDRSPSSRRHVGVNLYGGAELQLTGRLIFDAELGVHLLHGPLLDARSVAPGETIFRLKIAL